MVGGRTRKGEESSLYNKERGMQQLHKGLFAFRVISFLALVVVVEGASKRECVLHMRSA